MQLISWVICRFRVLFQMVHTTWLWAALDLEWPSQIQPKSPWKREAWPFSYRRTKPCTNLGKKVSRPFRHQIWHARNNYKWDIYLHVYSELKLHYLLSTKKHECNNFCDDVTCYLKGTDRHFYRCPDLDKTVYFPMIINELYLLLTITYCCDCPLIGI